ncbi:head GIN domain-containing protein [Paremcibacter congregatus]|uniref:Putative auto-transporter adhesin head GIN domain-containing protein n=1 Tax=Paremcibacter congregatus TaxID=2043170 RepID=A0A2G4YRR0_9PROT|nr:head GIN domain-containing protein [Paremcibacter congregatus]PHZ84967.1 hypothetical protein CRD36_09605 [Paremcibacter congregatus]QDE26058.1 DUF2807 domain-containing protein [Paremcibacter congregatus]|tara:strand:- start:1335 stop:2108 length:774 start_codon:yes stop_codon:yes gene_type:complete
MSYLKLFGIAAFAIGAILYLASADDHEVVVGEQDYDLEEFYKISINTSVNVRVKVAKDYGIVASGDEQDLKFLKVYVKGQTLVIENKRDSYSSWRGEVPSIDIFTPKLKQLTLNGSSDADVRDLRGGIFKAVINGSGTINFEGKVEELKIEINGSGDVAGDIAGVDTSEVVINGSGDVDLSGKCNSLMIEVNGVGDFSGRKYLCNQVGVDLGGAGDIEVFARNAIKVYVVGSGEVHVYGNPAKVKDKSRRKDHVILH